VHFICIFECKLYDVCFQLKEIIFTSLAKEESPLKIAIATVALGMGADLRHVARVIHAGPPKNIEGKC
jgi:superfamily II DNA helicase RecQ